MTMQQYSESLTCISEMVGDGPLPLKMVQDVDCLHKCLSADSPMPLVKIAAESVPSDVESHPVFARLTHFERGRICSVLGKPFKAVELYERAAQMALEVDDRETNWNARLNAAVDMFILGQRTEAEFLIRQVIKEGNADGYSRLGMLYRKMGDKDEAAAILEEGICAGSPDCYAQHVELMVNTIGGNEYIVSGEMMRIGFLAEKNGINVRAAMDAYMAKVIIPGPNTVNLQSAFAKIRDRLEAA